MTSAEFIFQAAHYVKERCVNIPELAARVIPRGVLEILLGKFALSLGDSPTSSIILGETINVLSMGYYISQDTKIGHTNNKYDHGTLLGTTLGVACKGSIIGGAIYFNPTLATQAAALKPTADAANYICEPVNRFFYLVSRERQDAQKEDMGYLEFIRNEAKASWFAEAMIGGEMRALSAAFLGGIAGKTGFAKWMRQKAAETDLALVKNLLGTPNSELVFNPHKEGIYDRIFHIYQSLNEAFKAKMSNPDINILNGAYEATKGLGALGIAGTGMFIIDVGFKSASEFTTGYLIIPPTRMIRDATETLIRKISDSIFSNEDTNSIVKDCSIDTCGGGDILIAGDTNSSTINNSCLAE